VNNLQPLVRSLLEGIFSPNLDAPSSSLMAPSLLIPMASHVFTGFLLSPLDLVRTRLIVQSSRYPSYNGPVDALRKILKHEGGLWGVYFHPHLFLPTIIDCTLRSVGPFALHTLVANSLSISPEHSFLIGCAEFCGNLASLLISMPFETVRRRLQIQARGMARPIRTCVEVRPVPYNGMVDAFWHIVTEERSDIPIQTKRHRRRSQGAKARVEDVAEKKDSWLRNTGIGQLYRGLGLRVGANVLVFLLAMMSGGDEPDAGWAEL
jgi:mitochondrial fusion and transport protein UGO1